MADKRKKSKPNSTGYVVVYARGGDNIADQIGGGVAFAARRWPSQPILVFGEVDAPDRPVLWQMLHLCGQGQVRAIVVNNLDRLTRHRVHLQHIRRFLTLKKVSVWLYGRKRSSRWV